MPDQETVRNYFDRWRPLSGLLWPGLSKEPDEGAFIPALKRRLALFSRQCWICSETELDEPTNEFMKPCRCIGSLRWVHVACMQTWIDTHHLAPALFCRFCGVEYNLVNPQFPWLIQLLHWLHWQIDRTGVVHLVYATVFGQDLVTSFVFCRNTRFREIFRFLIADLRAHWFRLAFVDSNCWEYLFVHAVYRHWPNTRPAKYPTEMSWYQLAYEVSKGDRTRPFMLRHMGPFPAFRQLVLISEYLYADVNELVPILLRTVEFVFNVYHIHNVFVKLSAKRTILPFPE